MEYAVLFGILLFMVGIIFGFDYLTKVNPELISGFKLSKDPEQMAFDNAWLRLYHKCMRIAGVVTLVGGMVAIFCKLHVAFSLFLILPIVIAAFYPAMLRCGKLGKVLYTILFVGIVGTVCYPAFYGIKNDLDVDFSKDKMEIKGMYGQEISYSDIKEVEMCQSRPGISYKANGFALGKICLGHFHTTKGENIMLYTYSDDAFVHITKNDGSSMYLSCKDKAATEQTFSQIQEKIKK